MPADRNDTIVSLAKRRGFVYPSSEIYGGQRSAWDYGPLGVELKENVKRQWWKAMVQGRDDIVGIDSSVILAREVWEASGHVTEFVDPLTECQSCHKRFRADQLIEAYEAKHGRPPANGLAAVVCPNCGTRGAFTEPRIFNGLLRTHLGPVEDESGLAYLRPETAQGIFINFANVLQSSRKKPPFGIAQVGKSFRNEITPGNFIFRTREFEQMEMEFFVEPGSDEQWHQYWIDERTRWYTDLGIAPASSNSTFQDLRSSAARSRAFGDRSAFRDSGSTAALTGASRRSSRSTLRFSGWPFALGASSSECASSRKVSTPRVSPAAGSITYGMYRSLPAWSKKDRSTPECSLCVFRSKSVRLAMPSSSPHGEPWKPNRYSMSTVRLE